LTVSTVRVAALTGLGGHERRRAAPAGSAFVPQGTRAPGAPRPRGRDPAEGVRLRRHLTPAVSQIALTRPQAAQGGARGAGLWGDVSDGEGIVVHLQADAEWARRCHGGPPSV
jgi:hypothetical protein